MEKIAGDHETERSKRKQIDSRFTSNESKPMPVVSKSTPPVGNLDTARVWAIIAARAKERQATHKKGDVYLPPNSAEGVETRDEVARIAGVGRSQVAEYDYVQEHGSGKDKEALDKGKGKSYQSPPCRGKAMPWQRRYACPGWR